MAKLSADDAAKNLENQVTNQKLLAKSGKDYVKTIADLGELTKRINIISKETLASQKEITDAAKELKQLKKDGKKLNGDALIANKKLVKAVKQRMIAESATLNTLKDQNKVLKLQQSELKETIKGVNKLNLAWNTTKNTLNASSKLIRTGLIGGFKKLTRSGAMGWSQDILDAQLNMGITAKHSQSFAKSITNAGLKTSALGVNAGDLAKAQAKYSTELGRAIELGQDGLVAITEMGVATGLGAEGAAAMVGELDKFNISAVGARDVIQETVDSATVLGLNSSKVIKQLQGNLKLAQKYHFKGGVKGMASMAQYATKMGVDMKAMGGMVEKAFRPEGAVKMAAQLQTMGGSFAQIADPFTLMFKARNDFEGFSKDIGKAAAELATFNATTGEFEISGLQLDRLKEVSKMTGVAEADLSQMALAGAKFNRIKTFLPPMMDKKDQELMSNIATVGKNGGYEVKIGVENGEDIMKDVRDLNKGDLLKLRKEEESLKKRAENAQSFTKKWDNLMMSFQTLLLPLINKLNDYLGPIIQDFSNALTGDGGFGEALMKVSGDIGDMIGKGAKKISDEVFGPTFFSTLKTFAEKIGSFVGTIADFVKGNPELTAALVGVLVLGGPIMSLVGVVGKFMGGIGSLIRGIGSLFGKGGGPGGGGGGGGRGKMGGMGLGLGLGAASIGASIWRSQLDDKNSSGGKALGVAGKAAEYGAYGSMLGPVGAGVGAAVGAGVGAYDEFFSRSEGKSTGGVSLPSFHQGTKEIKQGGIARVIGGEVVTGGITPLAKGSGVLNKNAVNKDVSMTVAPMTINGTVKLEGNNGQVLDANMLNNQDFKNKIIKMVAEGIPLNNNGGVAGPNMV